MSKKSFSMLVLGLLAIPFIICSTVSAKTLKLAP